MLGNDVVLVGAPAYFERTSMAETIKGLVGARCFGIRKPRFTGRTVGLITAVAIWRCVTRRGVVNNERDPLGFGGAGDEACSEAVYRRGSGQRQARQFLELKL